MVHVHDRPIGAEEPDHPGKKQDADGYNIGCVIENKKRKKKKVSLLYMDACRRKKKERISPTPAINLAPIPYPAVRFPILFNEIRYPHTHV